MRKLEVVVTYRYEIEVDDDDFIVQGYDNDDDMVEDLADYRFSQTLPVRESGGVKVKDVEVIEVSFITI